jgi:hypothetical protein
LASAPPLTKNVDVAGRDRREQRRARARLGGVNRLHRRRLLLLDRVDHLLVAVADVHASTGC